MSFCTVLILSVALGQGVAVRSPGMEDFVVTEKQAYLVLPPQAVGASNIAWMQWSPTGRYLLMGQMKPGLTPALVQAGLKGQEPPKPEMVLSFWDKTTGKTVELGRSLEPIPWHEIQWLAGKDIAVSTVGQEIIGPHNRVGLLRLDLPRKSMSITPLAEGGAIPVRVELYASPSIPKVLAFATELTGPQSAGAPPLPDPPAVAWVLDETGSQSNRVSLPAAPSFGGQWLADGRSMLIHTFPRNAEGKRVRTTFAIDAASLRIRQAAEGEPRYELDRTPKALMVRGGRDGRVALDVSSYKGAMLEASSPTSESKPYYLGVRVQDALLSPNLDAVTVLDQGVVTVRMITTVPMDLYNEAKKAAERAKALSDVKQVGLGLLMYATDYDYKLPGASEFNAGMVEPYLKNASLFNGFTYTFGGGSVAELKDPVRTMLGYKQAAGGFACVFADGHAKWLPQLPKAR